MAGGPATVLTFDGPPMQPDAISYRSLAHFLAGLPVHFGEVGELPDGQWLDLYSLALHANSTSRNLVNRMAVTELAAIAQQHRRFAALPVQPLASIDLARPVLIMQRENGDSWLLDGYRRVKFALDRGMTDLPVKTINELGARQFLLEHARDTPDFARIDALMLGVAGDWIETTQGRRRSEEALGPARPPEVAAQLRGGLIVTEKPRRVCLIDEEPEEGRKTNSDKDGVQVALENAIARVFYAGEAIMKPTCGRQAWVSRLKGPPYDVEIPRAADSVRPLNLHHLPHTRTIVQIMTDHEDRWRGLDHRRYLDPVRRPDRDIMARVKICLSLLGTALCRANEMAAEIRKLKRKAARSKDISHEDLAAAHFGNPAWEGPEIYRNMILIAHLAGFNPGYLWQQWQYLTDPLHWIIWGSAPVRGDDKCVTPSMAESFIHQRLNADFGEENAWSEVWAATNAMLSVLGRLNLAAEESSNQLAHS